MFGLPLAWVPLWQLAQLVEALKLPWSGDLAGIQARVPWQVSQVACVARWLDGLAGAEDPLWQVWHEPACTCAWVNFAPENALVVWQASQACVVGRCCADITTLPRASRAPLVWQLVHSRGVPLNTPPWWQASQRVDECTPVSA